MGRKPFTLIDISSWEFLWQITLAGASDKWMSVPDMFY